MHIDRIFIVGYHLLLLILWPLYFIYCSPTWPMILVSFALYFITGMGITVSYHRGYSHGSFKLNKVAEIFFLFFSTMAGEGSVIRWSHDHRIHHAFIDSDRDPYSIKKGFWFAHIGWLFKDRPGVDPKVVADLFRNKLLAFQHKHYGLLFAGTNIISTLAVGFLLHDFIGAFVLSLWTRLFFLHHCTWFINSLAHTWGSQSYSRELSAVDNYLISLVTFGEGYHNFHHAFAQDYRNGIRWFHYDPSKWLIWILERVGGAYDVKKVHHHRIQQKIVLEDKSLLLERIKEKLQNQSKEIEEKVLKMADEISTKLNQFEKLIKEYRESRKQHSDRTVLQRLKSEIKSQKKTIRNDWKAWKSLCKNLNNKTPVQA